MSDREEHEEKPVDQVMAGEDETNEEVAELRDSIQRRI